MTARIAIVLVTYNGWSMTRDCLGRLVPQLAENDCIIVVDNASQDQTPQKIQTEFPTVQVIASATNPGFGRANNLGVDSCKDCDLVVLLNNDTLPETGFVERLRARAELLMQKQGLFVLSPQVCNQDGSEQKNYYEDVSLRTFFSNAFRSESQAAKYLHGTLRSAEMDSSLQECAWTSAICWCMTKHTWELVGGFDPAIFMYYEDVDFAWRARKAGVRFLLDPNLSLVHLGGGSATSTLSRSLQHDNAQSYVFRKRWGVQGAFISWAFRLVRSGLRILVLAPLSIVDSKYRHSMRVHWGLLRNLFHA
jgi:GT2 family glycosyltransferase